MISAASLSEGPGLETSSSPRFTFGGLAPGVGWTGGGGVVEFVERFTDGGPAKVREEPSAK